MLKTVCILDTGNPGRLLGLVPAERALLAAARQGAARFVLVTADPLSSPLARCLMESVALQRKGIVPEVFEPARAIKALRGPLLVLSATAVLTPAAWAALPRVAAGTDTLLVNPGAVAGGGPVLERRRGRLQGGAATGGAGSFAGAWLLGSRGFAVLAKAFAAGSDMENLLRALPQARPVALQAGCGLLVEDGRARRATRRHLLRAMRKPTDGFVARHCNRYVSLFLSRFLIMVRLSPNAISFGNLVIGIGAAILAGIGGYAATLVGALLFQFTSIVDGCDGEVAKLTYRDSAKGAWIDTFCDQAGYLVFFIGLPIGLARAGEPALGLPGGFYLALGGLTLAVIPLLFLVMHRYVRRAGAGGSMLKILEDVQAAAREPGWRGRLNALVFRLSFVFRRDFFAAGALVLCAAGVSWLLMFTIAACCVGMLVYLLHFSARSVRT